MPARRYHERHVTLPEVKLHIVEAGEGPLVLLLHGFPDFWYGWRRQIDPLVAAGYRVVAPDLRGYNTSDKPWGLHSYTLSKLVGDVDALIAALGETSAMVVSHDWGGIVAWYTLLKHPERVSKLAVLNAPPPYGLGARPIPPDQVLRSWYVAAFQVPGLPEWALSANDFALLKRTLQMETHRPEAFTQEDLYQYAQAFKQPGALTAALNYYRALVLSVPSAAARLPEYIEQPVLVVWGDRDPHLAPALADLDPRRVPNGRTVHLPDAGHWVHLDAPARVNALLLDFLAGR